MNDGITFGEIFKMFKKGWWIIVLCTILGLCFGFYLNKTAAPPTYETESTLFIKKGFDSDNNDNAIVDNDPGRFWNTVSTYAKSEIVLNEVIKKSGLKLKSSDLESDLTVTDNTSSQLVTISLEGENLEETVLLNNLIVSEIKDTLGNYLNIERMEIVEKANKENAKENLSSRPKANILMGTMLGFVIGIFAAIVFSLILKKK